MKRKWRILLIGVVIVVLLVFAALLSLNVIAKAAVQKAATAALGTKTTVREVAISLAGGSVEIKGLRISNPEGFGEGNLFELDRAFVKAKILSFLSDVAEIDEVTLEAPVLKLRQQGVKSNLGVVLDNIKKMSPAGEPAPAKSSSMKFKVGLIKLTKAHIDYSLMGGPALPAPLPADITIQSISTAESTGVTLGKVIQQVLVEMAKRGASAGGSIIPSDVSDAIKGVGGGLGKSAKGLTDAVAGLGDLFGGKDQEKQTAPAAPEKK